MNPTDTTTINETLSLTVFIICVVALVAFIVLQIASWLRKKNEKKNQFKLTFFQVLLPKDNEIETKAAEHMFSNLIGFKKGPFSAFFTGQYRISFEIVSKDSGIAFYVAAPDEIATVVEKQINAAYPSAEIEIVTPPEIWDRGKYTKVAKLRLRGPEYFPIKEYEDLKNDTMSSITNAMSKMKENQVLALQYVIQPATDSWRMAGRSFINRIKNANANPERKSSTCTSVCYTTSNR